MQKTPIIYTNDRITNNKFKGYMWGVIMFNFFKECNNYGRKLQSTVNVFMLMVILSILNIFHIINISWITVIIIPFIVDVIVGTCSLYLSKKKGGGREDGSKE